MSNTDHTEPFTNLSYWEQAYRYEIEPFAKLIAEKARKLDELQNIDFMALADEERKRKWFYKEALEKELTTLYAFKMFTDSMLRCYTKSMSELSNSYFDYYRQWRVYIEMLEADNQSDAKTIDFFTQMYFKDKSASELTPVDSNNRQSCELIPKPILTT